MNRTTRKIPTGQQGRQRSKTIGPATAKRAKTPLSARLRRRAEERLRRQRRGGKPGAGRQGAGADIERVVHELRVHQIELEMQNEELRQTQHELEVSREKYFDLYDLAPVGYLTLNEPGLILEANLTAARLMGVARRDLLQQPLTRFILREDLGIFHQHLQQLFATRAQQNCELRLTRPGGAPFWVSGEAILAQDQGTAAPVCRVTFSDITTRKQADETMTRQLEILNATPDFIGFADARDTRILYLNPAGRKMIGWGAEEDVTRLKMAEVHPAWTNRLFREEILSIAIRDGVWKGECAFLHRDGREIPVTMVLLAHKSPGGKVERFSTISRDITERKQAEADLQRLAEFKRLAQLMKCASDVVLLADEHGRIIEANDRALETYGYSLAELRQKTVEDLRTPESRAELPHQIEQLETDGRSVFEAMNQRRDGAAFPVEISARFLEIAGVRYRLSIVRDNTKRKRAEEASRMSEARYRSLFDNMVEGFAYCRMLFEDGRPQDFIYVEVNEAFQIMTGLKNVTGRKVSEVIPGLRETNPELLERYGRVALTGQTERFETYVAALKMWFSISVYCPKKEHFVAVFDVITERKQMEEKLRASEHRYRELIDNQSEGIGIVDARKRFTFSNPAGDKIFGLLPGSLVGRTLKEFMAPDQYARMLVQTEGRRKGTKSTYELEIVRADGQRRWLQVAAVPRIDSAGEFVGTFGIFHDITERKRTEKKMQMFSQEIIAAREDERKRVSSVLHHDVGSLTVGISSHFDAIEQELRSGKPEGALKWMKRTRKLFGESVARLKKLAIELRPPELDVIGLRAALRQYFSQVTERAGIRIHFKETLGRRRVPGDTATILFRIAQEALTNAFTHGHATRVDADLSASKEEVRLTVRNNGKAFDPSGKAAQATSHMGIRVMHEMAVSAGGVCTVDSGRGKRTTVRVRLPIADWQKSRNHQSAIA